MGRIIHSETKEFSGFKPDRRALAEWVEEWEAGIVVMQAPASN